MLTTHADLVNKLTPSGTWRNFVNANAMGDGYGHGTSCCGVAGAQVNNGVGVAGHGGASMILPIKVVSDTNTVTWTDVAEGLVYAGEVQAQVASVSISGGAMPQTAEDAAQYATDRGVLIVAAAGNTAGNVYQEPAGLDFVLGVVGADSDRTIPSGYVWGSWYDVAAPRIQQTTSNSGGYSVMIGSSASTPAVAGICGLILALRPKLLPHQVRALFAANFQAMADAATKPISGGFLRADTVVTAAAALAQPLASAPSSVAAAVAGATATVTWAAVAGATSYVVRRSDTAGTTGRVIRTFAATGTSYSDTVTVGTTPYYTVSALNAGGESPQSSEAQASSIPRRTPQQWH